MKYVILFSSILLADVEEAFYVHWFTFTSISQIFDTRII
jgi:hypothetical protein